MMSSPTRACVSASDLRRKIFEVLKRLSSDGPVDVLRHGRVVASIILPAPEDRMQKPEIDPRRIVRLCKKHQIRRLALFGSVIRDDFGPDSDVDVLYECDGHVRPSLRRYMALHEALESLFGRSVDLLAFKQVSDKSVRSRSILASAQVIYAS